MAPYVVNGNVVAPEGVPSHVPRTAEGTNFILIQTRAPLNPAQKDDLEGAGVELLEFLGTNTYLCRFEPHDLQPLRRLSYVKNVSIYLRELKSTSALKQAVACEKDQEHYEIDCILHERPNITPQELALYIAEAAAVDVGELEIGRNKIRLVVHQDKLPSLAKLDSINRIEQVHKDETANDEARSTLLMVAGDGGPALSTSSQYEGQGQIICVADTGVDLGKLYNEPSNDIHPALAGRIVGLESFWLDNDARDIDGHGTHVCASVCGSGMYKHPRRGEVMVQGTAPASKIMVQSIALPLASPHAKKEIKIPLDMAGQLFQRAYDKGVRIHSNSWGKKWNDSVGQVDYEDQATEIDRFVYGGPPSLDNASVLTALESHEDFIILVAAGNNANLPSNPDLWPSQLGAAAAAKNAITVGACGSNRANDNSRFVDGDGLRPVTGIKQTAVFSSRGPTKSPNPTERIPGRIKPDIVAPGVAILSAASRALAADDWAHNRFGISDDKDWIFMSGTSMATPLVAGCVAILRQALEDLHGMKQPSSALIKALLVNGAINFSGKLGPGLGYDYEQGFGRVIVDSSIAMIRNGTFVDGRGDAARTTENGVTRFEVPGLVQAGIEGRNRWDSGFLPIPAGVGRSRLVVTLAHPDPAGAHLQNCINLVVLSGGSTRRGNMGRNESDTVDKFNNVEKVLWDNVPGPTFKVIVEIDNVWKPKIPASFAVTWDVRAMAKL